MSHPPCVVVPPSPNWYGAHLAAEHPHEPLVAYAGHDAAVIVRCGGGGGESSGVGGESGASPSIVCCLAPHPARVTSVAFAPASDDDEGEERNDQNGGGGDENGRGGGSSSSGSGGGGGGGADATAATTTTPTPLLVCGCEDGTAVCWDARRGIRTRAARRYRSALSAVVAVTMMSGGGGDDAEATKTTPTRKSPVSFAVFGDSSGRLLAWSYGTGERSKPAPLAAKLPDHGGVVCLAAAAESSSGPLLLLAGCRDGTVACVELRPHDDEEGGAEAPCASSVRFVFSPYECGGGGRPRPAGAAATTTAAAAAAGQQRAGRKAPAASSSSSPSTMPPEAVQALQCFQDEEGQLLLLTGTAAGGLALWDALDESFSSSSSPASSSSPRPLARASLPRLPPSGPGGGGGGGGQAPWTAARVVPGSLRHEDDGGGSVGTSSSCVVAAGAPGGALVLLTLRWRRRRRREQGEEGAATATPRPPAAAPPLVRTRAAHSRPVFAVCFPGGGGSGAVLATISMDRCFVLSRVVGVSAGARPPPPPPPPPSSPKASSATASTAAAIQPFWRTQGLGGYAYAMDARSGLLAIACGDRTMRLVSLRRRRTSGEGAASASAPTATAIGEPELVWSGATSKPLCCAWRPGARLPPLLAWGDADGRVGTLSGGGGGVAGGGAAATAAAAAAAARRFEPFPHARHGGPALQLSWSPGPNPALYSLGGEGCLLRWAAPASEAAAGAVVSGGRGGPAAAAAAAAAAAVAAVVGPGLPVDVSPSLHAALMHALGSVAAAPQPPPARQWTAVAWHPRLPLLAAAADDGAVAVFLPSAGAERERRQDGHDGADQQEEQEDEEHQPAHPRWRVVGFCARPGADVRRRGRVRRLAWAASPPSSSEDRAPLPLLLAAVHARDLAVFAVDPRAAAAVAAELPAYVVRASDSVAAAAAPGRDGGGNGGGGGPSAAAGDEAMDAAWLPAGAGGDDPDPLLVVGLGNGRLRAWRVRVGREAATGEERGSSPPPSLFLVPTAAAAAGAAGLPAHADAVQSLAPVLSLPGDDVDEPLLLTGSRDQSVRVWRARDFGPLAGAGDASAAVGELVVGADDEEEEVEAPPPRAAAASATPAPVSQRHWRRLLPAGTKQAMPDPPAARTPQERAACLSAVRALARALLPLPGEEEEQRSSGDDPHQHARLLALMVADADAVALDPELRRDAMSAERRAALAVWRGDVRGALAAAGGGGGAAPAPPPIGADGAVVAASAGGAAWRAASQALAMAADASGQPCTAAVHRRAAGEEEEEAGEEEAEGRGGDGGGASREREDAH